MEKETVKKGPVRVRRKTTRDTAVPFASFLLGIALTLIIMFVFMTWGNIVLSWVVSVVFVLLFLIIVLAIVKPSKSVVVRNEEVNVIKEVSAKKTKGKYVASTESRTYHNRDCRFAKAIKSQYRLENDEPKFFKDKKFKACGSCKPR